MTISIFSRLVGLSAVVVLAGAAPALAQDYSHGHGHGALEIFDGEGQANAPVWVKIWLPVMLATFAASLFFVRRRIEARWVAGGVIAGFIALGVLAGIFGMPQFSGFIALLHLIFWSPALFILLRHRTFLTERSLYGAWTGLVTAVILFSFVFDVRDATIYLDHVLGIGALS